MRCFASSTKIASVGAAATLSLAAALALVVTYDGTWLHPDTTQALSVARNLLQGNGFSTSVVYYEEHYQLDTWPAPQTVFPIGFPAMIAAIGWFGVPLQTAAFLISVVGFVLVPPLICLAAQRMGRKPATSLLLAALWLCSPMIWRNVLERQTEMMFIALTLGSLVLLQSSALTTRRLLLSGSMAALALSLRYAGLFWLITIGTAMLIQLFVQGRTAAGRILREGVSFIVVPASLAILLFARNAALVGDVKGGNNKEVSRTIYDAALTAWYGISGVLGLDKSSLISGNESELLAAAGLCLIFGAALMCLVRSRLSPIRRAYAGLNMADLSVLLYIVVTIATLVALECRTSINLSPRMFLPLIPFALLAASDVIGRILNLASGSSLWNHRLLCGGSCLLVLGVLGGQLRVMRDTGPQMYRFGTMNDVLDQEIETDAETVNLRELLQGTRVLSEVSQLLAESLQQGTVGLTSETYTKRVWTDEEVVRLIRKYHINRVVVFPQIQPKDANPFFESLAPQSVRPAIFRPWLEPLVISPQIHIYGVRNIVLLTQQI